MSRKRARRRPGATTAAGAAAAALSVISTPLSVPIVVARAADENDAHADPLRLADARNRCCRHSDELPPIELVADVDKLERVSCNITREYFEMKFEAARQMVMLVGCDEGWPARERWTPEGLVGRFSNTSLWRAKFSEEIVDFNSRTEWSEIVEAMVNDDFFYIVDSLEEPEAATLLQDFVQPKPIKGIVDLYATDEELLTDFPKDFGWRRWILFGSADSGTPPHYDIHETDTWMTSVRGHKWWVFFPKTLPRMVDTHGSVAPSLQCSKSCSYDDWDVADWFASVGLFVDQEDYDGEHPFHVLQRPGETIYIPAGFAHAVWNMEDTFGVTVNWASPYNVENLWRFLVRTAEPRIQQKFYDGLDSSLKNIVDDIHVPEVEEETRKEGQQCYQF